MSVLLGLVYTEFTGMLTGGLVSAGYLALFVQQPARIGATLAFSGLIWLAMRALSVRVILYGRRRFALTVALSFVAWFLAERFLLPFIQLPA
ncbi:MAG: poly-gamma-glutamate biosynthesis protein PgsC, partial [Clostridiales bacterium]|nr:poly-gamma-glutamate biosynthesis protein PgsC [Clostridiales bacterium]